LECENKKSLPDFIKNDFEEGMAIILFSGNKLQKQGNGYIFAALMLAC